MRARPDSDFPTAMTLRPLIAACLATIALASCTDRQDEPLPQVPESVSEQQAAQPVDEAPSPSNGVISVDPAGYCRGEKRQQAVVAWDVRELGVRNVAIHVGPEPEARAFARGGGSGHEQTGAWAAPGMVFVVRDAANGDELGRVELQTLDC